MSTLTELQSDITLVRSELRGTELRLKNELIKWILATGVTTILAIAGLLKVMAH